MYNPDGVEDSMTGGGRNGSDNFLTTFGYLDFDFPYGDGRPILEFADNKARTIRSLYVNSTCYFYSVATSGNGLSPELTKRRNLLRYGVRCQRQRNQNHYDDFRYARSHHENMDKMGSFRNWGRSFRFG